MKNVSYKVENDNTATIHLYGEIGWDDSYWGEGTNNTDYNIVSLIRKLEKEAERINIYINSPGGCINDGLAIFNAIKQSSAEIHTYNDGFVGSMASIIMLAGTTHFPTTSIFHLHSASTYTRGNIEKHKESIEMLETYESVLKQTISDKSGLSIEDVAAKFFDGKEHFMTAIEAQELGVVDFLEDYNLDNSNTVEDFAVKNYSEIIKMYQANLNKPERSGFFNEFKKMLSPRPKNMSKQENSVKLNANLTATLAVLALEDLPLVGGNVEISVNDIYKLEAAINERDAQIKALTTERDTQAQELENLRNIVKNKQVDEPANPKADDNSGAEESDGDISNEVREKLRAYNRSKNN